MNQWYVYEDWMLTGIFRAQENDERLDAFITRVWARLSSIAMRDSWESEYEQSPEGNLRLAIVRFTILTQEPINDGDAR